MMRSLLLFLLLFAGACSNSASTIPAPAQPLRSLNSGLGTLVSVEPVRVEEGFEVWRQGTRITVQDGLLIRLDGLNGSDFIAQAGTPPMFVLGDTIGVTLAQPLEDGKALLLMHSPPADTEVPLWVTSSDMLPHRLQGTTLVAAQQAALAATASDGLNIQTPPASVPRTVYSSLPALRLAVLNMKMPREVCALVGKECGVVPRTQFGMIDCGACEAGKLCTSANQCCTPSTCTAQGRSCGAASDGCGNKLECGTCPQDQVCTTAGACCTPTTCAKLGRTCGTVSDGCGNTLECGTCSQGQICTRAGGCCTPKTCAELGRTCGTVSDGCGNMLDNMLDCGNCAEAQMCTVQGACCTPKTCADLGRTCGTASNGCDFSDLDALDCGTCSKGQVCTTQGACCTPKTCAMLNKNCGTVSDDCGGTLSCGTCTVPQTCGGGGTANVCGTCTPETDAQFCSRMGANCGTVTGTDNCGTARTVNNCGSCSTTGYACENNVCVRVGSGCDGLSPTTCNNTKGCVSYPTCCSGLCLLQGSTCPFACPPPPDPEEIP